MKRNLFILLLSLYTFGLRAQVNLDSLYHCLDREIDRFPEYVEMHEAKLDDVVESCYPGYPFQNDEARLDCLFNLYEKMSTAEKPNRMMCDERKDCF